MIISVINISEGRKSDADVLRALRAVNRQLAEDFQPYWGFGAQLRLEGKTGQRKNGVDPADMRGDAVLYIRDKADVSQEMCDPVQCEYYAIDGIEVSNFLLPLYFTSSDEHGGRNDFLGTLTRGKTLRSFGVNPGGYVGYFDPKIGKDVTHYGPDDVLAKRRLAIKGKLKAGRGNLRRRRALA